MNCTIKKNFNQILTSIGICIFLLSCTQTQPNLEQLPNPQITAGTARVRGKLTSAIPEGLSSLTLRYENPVTADESIFETNIEKDDGFYFEVPVETSVVFGSIEATGYGGTMIVLSTDKDTYIELKIEAGRLKESKTDGVGLLTKEDMKNYGEAVYKYSSYGFTEETAYVREPLHRNTPQEYAEYEMKMMEKRREYSLRGIKFSKAGEELASNELYLLHLGGRLLAYKEVNEEPGKDYTPQEPDSSYYSFLKYFDLNNPKYIYNFNYSKTMQQILSAKGLHIPSISDTPVQEWLTKVKITMADLVGFDSGQFYDMLAANTYARQFNEEGVPLSEKQKENIKNYFGDGEIAKILLRKNEDIARFATEEPGVVVINETPLVSKEKLMDTIISKYKGRAVFVDFWATWCGPCLDAMKKIKPVKNELRGKNIVYVFITDESSPKGSWSEMIKNMYGEHYYLSKEEWGYLLDNFEFTGIPTYLFYDANGILKNKVTGYPGSEKMQKMIEEIVP